MKRAPRSIGAILFVLGTFLFSANAEAAPGSRLVYGRATGATTCPDEAELRAAVRARLGYDPFFPWADQTVVVHVAARPNRKLNGKVYVVDAQGRASPEREFTTSVDECQELILALSLAIVIAVDPLHGTVSAAAPPADKRATPDSDESRAQAASNAASASEAGSAASVATISSQASAAAAPATPAGTDGTFADRGRAVSPAIPVTVQLGAGPLLGTGLTPGISSGLVPFVRARIGYGSIAAEGRYEVSVWTPSDLDPAAVSLWGGAITPCLHWKVMGFCSPVLLGRYRAEGLETATAFFASAGLRVGAEIPMAPTVWGFLRAEGLINFTRHDLFFAGDRIWQVPALGFSLSAGAVVSIL